jgi:methionyl-tRNA formyltransferase
MVQAMDEVAGGAARPIPQPEEGAVYARKIKPAEARIRWERPAARTDRQIRGLSPFPGAWFQAPSERGPVRVKALLSRAEEGEGEPGEILDDGLLIACGEGAVRILRAQREGRAPQGAEAFLRGFPLRQGQRLS